MLSPSLVFVRSPYCSIVFNPIKHVKNETSNSLVHIGCFLVKRFCIDRQRSYWNRYLGDVILVKLRFDEITAF